MRKIIIGSSWKMHISSIREGENLANEIKKLVGSTEIIEMFILPTFPMIPLISNILRDCNIKWGAQNVSFSEKGAFTGEVPPMVLNELGCRYVEIGHAERRLLFNETDEIINKKVKLTLKYGMTPLICIGESAADKDNKLGQVRVKTQVLWTLEGLDKEEMRKIIFAYEPVWAIGQQEAANEDYVENMHAFIRDVITKEFGKDIGDAIRLIYGGSVSPENAGALTKKKNVDGLFIGRFGLNSANFEQIVRAVLNNIENKL